MAPGQELTTFGIERDYEYTGHTTLATHLVPLPRRIFASTDETHIKIWGLTGDIVKTTFPSNRRSMVSAMTYCSTFSALLTAEVDMTLKAYATNTLDLLDTFPLGQAQRKGEKNTSNEKVLAMVYLPQHCWLLLGSEAGCDLWCLNKSLKRRAGGSVGRLEHHLQLQILRRISALPVLSIVADLAEQRIIIWGPKSLSIYDTELNMITNCRQPQACSVRCACIQILTILETSLLTGCEDGNVNFWSIHGTQKEGTLDDSPKENFGDKKTSLVSMRLEHTFRGHSRTVEVVNFYQRKQSGSAPSLCVSYSRDGRMKVWSLVEFSIVYTLDVSFLDSKVFIFPLSQHCFAFSAAAPGGAGTGQGQRTTLSLMRFTSHVACPFATTSQSPVIIISRPLPPSDFRELDRSDTPQVLSGAVALVSEDVAVRIVDADAKRLIACLPPPPNSKVQVLRVFLVPVWQILVLWLSSQEIAIFFVPAAGSSQNNEASKGSDMDQGQEANRAVRSTTPLLIRRFSIFEVRAHSFDKELPKEAFRSVALHHGKAPPNVDTCTGSASEAAQQVGSDDNQDWFLIVGTHVGTLQAYRLRSILAASPIWHRIVKHLPQNAWKDSSSGQDMSSYLPSKTYNVASGIEKARLEAFEAELLEAMEAFKVPGQRPFPRDAPPLQFHGRWRCHDYFVDRTEAVHSTLMTLDMKRNMKLWKVETMHCIFRYCLGEFTCYTPYLSSSHTPVEIPSEAEQNSIAAGEGEEGTQSMFSGLKAYPDDGLRFTGLALGSHNGSLQLVMLDKTDCRDPEVLVSSAVHGKEVLQIDYIWPINVFVTIGGDYALKIWTRALVLIREIAFPQPLTSVAFRHRHDMDANRGHGDILLGFSSHVASISFDFWIRGAPEEFIGRNSIRGRALESRDLHFTSRGFPVLDASEDIDDHRLWLHAEDPVHAHQQIAGKKGVNIQGAAFVARFKDAMLAAVRMGTPPNEKALASRGPPEQGDILDFRGGPVVDLASLSGQAVDRTALDLSKRPSREPSIRHKRTNHHNKGDFSCYTHDYSHYYDKYVVPNYIVDAPRCNTIRGVGDENNSALITSMGSKRANLVDPESQTDARNPEAEEIPDTNLDLEKPFLNGVAQDAKEMVKLPVAPTRSRTLDQAFNRQVPNSTRALNLQSSFKPTELSPASREGSTTNDDGGHDGIEQGDTSAAGESPQHDRFSESQEEPWRNRHIARGAPREDLNRPRLQDIANSDLDTARLLVSRRNISEVPDLPEENKLKQLMVKKTEWLYSPSDSHVLEQKRTTIQRMQEEHGAKQFWTPAGRLVCGEGAPPAQSIPWSARPVMKPRMPITRTEVTEQRIIERAAHPPTSPPQFTLDARRSRYIPTSARSTSTSSRVESRNGHKAHVESPHSPVLSAR